MKILISLSNLKIGGAQAATLRLAKQLSIEGMEVLVYDHNPDIRDIEFVSGIYPTVRISSIAENHWVRWFIWKLNAIFSLFNFDFHLFQKINEYKFSKLASGFDIVHSNMFASDKIVSKLNKQKKRPVLVLTMHGCYEEQIRLHGLEKSLVTFEQIVSRFDKIGYLTESNISFMDVLDMTGQPQIRKIYNGFPIENSVESISKLGKTIKIGMVGRGVRLKGWEEAILIIIKLNEYHKSTIELHLFGDGEFLNSLESKYSDYSFLKFRGFVPKPMDEMKFMNIGILPSYTESMPTCIVEFLSLGIPCVVSDVGESRNMLIFDNLKAGSVVPLKEGFPDIDLFVEKISEIITNRDLYHNLSNNAFRIVKRFDIRDCTRNYVDFYKS